MTNERDRMEAGPGGCGGCLLLLFIGLAIWVGTGFLLSYFLG